MNYTIVNEYLDYQDKYEKEYGSNTIVLMEVGSFYEIYGIENENIKKGKVREITEICHRVRGVIPVINWPHLHARGNRWLNDRDSFKRVFAYLDRTLGLEKYYMHFSGVEFDVEGNERHYSPIKKGEIKFEYLAETILENNYNVIVISDSPLMEHDAMYMKLITERVESRRQERMARREASEKIKESRKAAAEIKS